MSKRNGISVKSWTRIVACASALKAIICICKYACYYNGYILFISNYHDYLLINMICWIATSVFFFTLYKNMK